MEKLPNVFKPPIAFIVITYFKLTYYTVINVSYVQCFHMVKEGKGRLQTIEVGKEKYILRLALHSPRC